MRFPTVENVCTSSGIVLVISRGLQLPYRKKSNTLSRFTRLFSKSRILPLILSGVHCWGHIPCSKGRRINSVAYICFCLSLRSGLRVFVLQTGVCVHARFRILLYYTFQPSRAKKNVQFHRRGVNELQGHGFTMTRSALGPNQDFHHLLFCCVFKSEPRLRL